ncbi:hypothetical protein [Blastococcus brunescens]|uniref:Uncharacterized protein n=1 Tax=Blastococcus brunescens TaxID=1564165 RepID=A0ABZ1AYK3_9ACTN|nr:hypothetical protein [Blastococcus sp. BMG 8361]WRL62179.1 hypothetical protein U6N30_19270 [Blastococcus sp. BMG 8361]
MTDTVVPDAGARWAALTARFPTTGLWPLLLQSLYDGTERPWDSGEFAPTTETEIDATDAPTVLEDGWRGSLVPIDDPWAPGTGPLLRSIRPSLVSPRRSRRWTSCSSPPAAAAHASVW